MGSRRTGGQGGRTRQLACRRGRAVWFLFARSRRGSGEFLLAVAAIVVGFVAFGKILSTQYMVWVVFAVPLALGRIRPFALAATVSATLLALYIYEWGLFDLIAGGRAGWVLLTRNLILVALFGCLLVELAQRRSVRESP